MKNIIFVLTTIFTLQFHTIAISQNNTSTNNFRLIQIHQIDLVSAEMLTIINGLLERPEFFYKSNEVMPLIDQNIVNLPKHSFLVTFDSPLKSDAKALDWSSPNFPTIAHQALLSDDSAQQFEELFAIQLTNQTRWGGNDVPFTQFLLQNFIGEQVKSFMQPADIYRWIELESNEWIPNEIELPTNKFEILDWQGQLGLGIGSYY